VPLLTSSDMKNTGTEKSDINFAYIRRCC